MPQAKPEPELTPAASSPVAKPAKAAPGAVIQCLQPGYELLGRLVRPAMVVVAARSSGGGSTEGDGRGANLDTRA